MMPTYGQQNAIKNIKRLIWAYFILLIFEGALRKWVLPGLATPLLIVRDPIAIALIFTSVYNGLWRPNIYVTISWLVSLIGLCTALIFGHGYLSVGLYGCRIMMFHFPLIFIFGKFLDQSDLFKMGKVMLWFTVGMTILVALQFYSPQGAWVNRGIGGDLEGSGFSGSEGFYRVPGTFSFTNGLSYFYNLATCFIVYFLLAKKTVKVNKLLLFAALIALIIAVPLSISRTVFFQICVTLLFVVVASFRNKALVFKIVGGAAAVGILLFLLSDVPFIKPAISAFTTRFERANTTEGGAQGVIIDRFLGGMFDAVQKGSDSFFGQGLGLGSQAGARLATGTKGFLISEGEWGRLIGEQGIFFGLILILIRGILCFDMLKKSWAEVKHNNLFSWVLLSFGLIIILQGQWAQPTVLGFAIITGGFIVAGFTNKSL